MMTSTVVLKPPETFPFPFQPYPIQHEFMSMLYSTLEEGKLGIFESPTGTGKSLSIICGALCWLQDHLAREKAFLEEGIENFKKQEKDLENESDWISGQSRKLELERNRRQLQEQLKLMMDEDEEIQRMKEKVMKKVELEELEQSNRTTKSSEKDSSNLLEDEDLLLEDVDVNVPKDCDSDAESENKEKEKYYGMQIIICSRTHSQLSQLVGEVIRSPYNDVRLVPLASRQSYCVNAAIRKLNSLTLINEKCSDMQRGSKGSKTKVEEGATVKKSKGSSGCQFLRSSQAVTRLSEEALVKVQDVEALVEKGKKLSACPYYATRAAVSKAQVLVVPYNTLLHKETREACGLRLKGNVVIVDEAHNLLDAISQVHSAHLTGYQVTHAYSQLVQYRDRYSKRFSATNLLYLEQIIFVVARLIRMLGGKPGCPPNEGTGKVINTKLYSLGLFLTEAQIDNINQFKLVEFARKSKLSHKLHGFSERYQPSVNITPKPAPQGNIRTFLKEISSKSNTPESEAPSTDSEDRFSKNPILPVIAFLQALTSSCKDGRVVCSTQLSVGRGSLKYLLLNPAAHFSDIVTQARSVVVCGGTMQPVSEFLDQLFVAAGAEPQRISQFSCGHVIPPDHILPVVLTSGPTGKPFDFSYQNRNSTNIISELGRTLYNFCNIVPGGVVCFFGSYDYEQTVYQHLQKSGLLDKLSSKKKIFREPRKSNEVDRVLSDYATAVSTGLKNPVIKPNGALLFSVVGGKLSEGLNFSDDLGRCVIVVGMPYPNIKSPELQEKMSYLDKTLGVGSGQCHYENLCMKAVNQCIGRAVRHRNDYATVMLLDARYARQNTIKLLPSWIQGSLQTHHKMGTAVAAVAKFFAAKRTKNTSQ